MKARRPTKTGKPYRADIDGLRAIAVLSVVLYHADRSVVPGGFVGVDIFFVISGFLIGGIIFDEASKGQFSFASFYARRARRILPALITVVAMVLLVSVVYLGAEEMIEVGKESASALLGLSNVLFWWTTGYFTGNSSLHPLLMTWSLGVEEQFYVIFPFVIIAIARVEHKWRLATMAGLAVLSFVLSIWMLQHTPTGAFYLLPPRAWELAFGAALAMSYQEAEHIRISRSRNNDIIGAVGLALLVLSLTVFDDQSRFPGFAVLLPALGTLILLHTEGSFVNKRLLSWKPIVFVGLISYSWYLWHWPLMAFARITTDRPPPAAWMWLLVALSFGIAVLSWRFIESPFRRGSRTPLPVLRRAGLALGLAVTPALLLICSGGWPARLPAEARVIATIQADGAGTCLGGFGSTVPIGGRLCQPVNPTAALIGDSHAAALAPGLTDAIRARGGRLLQLAHPACVPLIGIKTSDMVHPEHAEECSSFMAGALRRVVEDANIDLVIIASSWPNTSDARFRDAQGRRVDAMSAIKTGLPPVIARLIASRKRVIVVGDVPRFDFDPLRHMTTESMPLRRFIAHILESDRLNADEMVARNRLDKRYAPIAAEVHKIAVYQAGSSWFDLSSQICNASACSFQRGQKPLFFDQHHLSSYGARSINWGAVL